MVIERENGGEEVYIDLACFAILNKLEYRHNITGIRYFVDFHALLNKSGYDFVIKSGQLLVPNFPQENMSFEETWRNGILVPITPDITTSNLNLIFRWLRVLTEKQSFLSSWMNFQDLASSYLDQAPSLVKIKHKFSYAVSCVAATAIDWSGCTRECPYVHHLFEEFISDKSARHMIKNGHSCFDDHERFLNDGKYREVEHSFTGYNKGTRLGKDTIITRGDSLNTFNKRLAWLIACDHLWYEQEIEKIKSRTESNKFVF